MKLALSVRNVILVGLVAPAHRAIPPTRALDLNKCVANLNINGAQQIVPDTQTSKLRTVSAFDSMNARRGSTSSPISLEIISSDAATTEIYTLSKRRTWGSIVVSQS